MAIKLDPKYARGYRIRADTYRDKGDYERAIADHTEAIRFDPKAVNLYFARGRMNLHVGALPKAAADLNQASDLNPKYAYTALWLDIVNKRSNVPSQLERASEKIDMTTWPAPVIRLYLGRMTRRPFLLRQTIRTLTSRRTRCARPIFTAAKLLCSWASATTLYGCSSSPRRSVPKAMLNTKALAPNSKLLAHNFDPTQGAERVRSKTALIGAAESIAIESGSPLAPFAQTQGPLCLIRAAGRGQDRESPLAA